MRTLNGHAPKPRDGNANESDSRARKLQARFLNYILGFFAASFGCCFCFAEPDEVSPFWTTEAGEESITQEDYYNETFESEATTAQTQTQTASQPTKPAKTPETETATKTTASAAKSPSKSPIKSPLRKTSESESEDSFSVAETTSDQSDVEGRIRTLTEELKRRKVEAEKLKKEQKKKKKEKLRAQEDSLKKQIEAYDEIITKAKEDSVQGEDDQVRPQIKQPSESKRFNKLSPEQLSPPTETRDDRRLSSDSLPESPVSTPKSPLDGSPSEILEDIPEESGTSERERSLSNKLEINEKSQSVRLSIKDNHTDDDITYSEDFTKTAPRSSAETDKSEPAAPPSVHVSEKTSLHEEVPEEASLHTARSITEQSEKHLQEQSEKSEALSHKSERKSVRQDSLKSNASDFSEDFESESYHSRTESSHTDSHVSRSDRSDTRSYTSTESRKTVEKTHEDDVDTDDDVSERLSEDGVTTPRDASEAPEPLDFSKDTIPVAEVEPVPQVPEAEEKESEMAHAQEVSSLSQEEQEDVLGEFKIGDRVLVGGVQPGTLRFKGPVAFAPGHWGGVELDVPEGRHSGSVQGVSYFDCRTNHGLFAPPEKLSHLPTEEDPASDAESHHTKSAAGEGEADESIAEDISIATDSELERVISAASAAVEEFADELNTPRGAPENEADLEEEFRQHQKSLDLTAQNLINESISQMLGIYHKKLDLSSPTKEDFIIPPASPETEETPKQQDEEFRPYTPGPDILNLEDEEPPKTPEAFPSSERGDTPFKFPGATEPDDEFKTHAVMEKQNFPSLDKVPQPAFMDEDDAQDDLDKLYDELGALTGDNDEWFDDDFGFGMKQKDPPPYQDGKKKNDLRLDLQKVSQEPFYAIPHKREQLVPLTDDAVSVFWERRRNGESWDEVEPPTKFFASEDDGKDMESRSKKAYKKLVFDLSGDILRDVYQDEEALEPAPWMKAKRIRKKYYRGLSPPRTQDDVVPIVEKNVCNLVSSTKDSEQRRSRISKWSRRKKGDHVDKVLLTELAEEEPDWIDYNDDELTVKMQLADSIFESLLAETGSVLEEAARRKTARTTQSQ